MDKVARVAWERGDPFLTMGYELVLPRLHVNARLDCAGHGWEATWRNTRVLELMRIGTELGVRVEVVNGIRRRRVLIASISAIPTTSELTGELQGDESLRKRTGQPTSAGKSPFEPHVLSNPKGGDKVNERTKLEDLHLVHQ